MGWGAKLRASASAGLLVTVVGIILTAGTEVERCRYHGCSFYDNDDGCRDSWRRCTGAREVKQILGHPERVREAGEQGRVGRGYRYSCRRRRWRRRRWGKRRRGGRSGTRRICPPMKAAPLLSPIICSVVFYRYLAPPSRSENARERPSVRAASCGRFASGFGFGSPAATPLLVFYPLPPIVFVRTWCAITSGEVWVNWALWARAKMHGVDSVSPSWVSRWRWRRIGWRGGGRGRRTRGVTCLVVKNVCIEICWRGVNPRPPACPPAPLPFPPPVLIAQPFTGACIGVGAGRV